MDKNINESIRKPRRTKGTPFFLQRNYFALGALVFGGVSWYLYELWPETKKLKKSIQEGKFKYSPELQAHIETVREGLLDANIDIALSRQRLKKAEDEEKSTEQPWLSKILSSKVDLSEKISKYFRKETEKTDSFESPYKEHLSDQKVVLNDTASDENDFKTPKELKRKTTQRVIETKSNVSTKRKKENIKRTTKTRQTKLTKLIESQFFYTDTNPEHLQMAIALSKSEQADENFDDDPGPLTFPSTQEKISNVRATLEQFGFKSKRPSSGEVIFEGTKRSKTSKYRYVTPVLFMRKQEDRDLEIAKKVSLILSETAPFHQVEKEEYYVSSDYLENFVLTRTNFFQRNNLDHSLLSKESFYVEMLNLPHSTLKCGALLKDWDKIPGRDKSPVRKLEEKMEVIEILDAQDIKDDNKTRYETTPKIRETSPDLFASDDEVQSEDLGENLTEKLRRSMELINEIKTNISRSQDVTNSLKPLEITFCTENFRKNSERVVALSASMASNFQSLNDSESDYEIFETDKGIEHFESFNAEADVLAFNLSQKCNENLTEMFDVSEKLERSPNRSVSRNCIKKIQTNSTQEKNKKVLLEKCDDNLPKHIFTESNDDITKEKITNTTSPKHKRASTIFLSEEKSAFKYFESFNLDSDTSMKNTSDMDVTIIDEIRSGHVSKKKQPENTVDINRSTSDTSTQKVHPKCFENKTFLGEQNYLDIIGGLNETSELLSENFYGVSRDSAPLIHSIEISDTDSESDRNLSDIVNKKKSFSSEDEDKIQLNKDQVRSKDDEERNQLIGKSNDAVENIENVLEEKLINTDFGGKKSNDDDFKNQIDSIVEKANDFFKKLDISKLLQREINSGNKKEELSNTTVRLKNNTTLLTEELLDVDKTNDTFENMNITEYIQQILNKPCENLAEKCDSNNDDVDNVTIDLTEDSDEELNGPINENKLEDISDCNSEIFDEQRGTSLSLSDDSWSEDTSKVTENDMDQSSDYNALEYEEYFKFPLDKNKYIEYACNHSTEIGKNTLKETLSDSDGSDESELSDNRRDFTKIGFGDKNFDSLEFKRSDDSDHSDKVVNSPFLNELLSKPIESDCEEFEQFCLSAESCTPKKFRKSLSLDQYKSVRKPTPKKKIKRSLTFSSPGENSKKRLFGFKECGDIEKFTSLNSLMKRQDSSDSIYISDEEVNYSSVFSTPPVQKNENIPASPDNKNAECNTTKTPTVIHKRITELTPNIRRYTETSKAFENSPSTPANVVIKTRNVTPMPDYDRMNTPTISSELEKVGVKHLKRLRGVQLLKHIYESTHPFMDSEHSEDGDDDRTAKRRKSELKISEKSMGHKDIYEDTEIFGRSNDVVIKAVGAETIDIVGDIPESEELIFERTRSKKIASCALPLHIAWHNFLACQPELKENILLYVPLQLEVLYSMLKEQGHKYHVQDLLTFLDKKCITIRTNQHSSQNRHRRKMK